MYWNCEEEQWERHNSGVKPTEIRFCKPQVVSLWGESLRSCFLTNSAKSIVAGMGLGTRKVWWWMMIFWFQRIFVFLVNCFAHIMTRKEESTSLCKIYNERLRFETWDRKRTCPVADSLHRLASEPCVCVLTSPSRSQIQDTFSAEVGPQQPPQCWD